MFDRRRRAEYIARGAATFMERGEHAIDVVQVSAGVKRGSTVANVGGDMIALPTSYPARYYALVTSDRNLYALALGGARVRAPVEVLFKWPLAQVSARRNGKRIYLRENEDTPERGFDVVPLFGKRADRLVARLVDARNGVVDESSN